MKVILCANVGCANRLEMKMVLDDLKQSGCNDVHIEIKDGYITGDYGLDFLLVKEIKKNYDFKIEIHILTQEITPALDIALYSEVDLISFHPNFYKTPIKIIEKIKSRKILVGISLMPDRPVQDIFGLLDYVDYVNVLGTEHTEENTPVDAKTIEKIGQLNWQRNNGNRKKFGIQIDGGVDIKNIKDFKTAGADVAVLGKRGLFYGQQGVNKNLQTMKRALK